MPLFDQMYYDQKWSLWDSWLASVARNIRTYVVTAGYSLGRIITASKNRGYAFTGSKNRGKVITTGG